MSPSAHTGFLPVDGPPIYYEIRGRDGPLLVLISAGMGSAHAHELTSGQLCQRFRVLTYDRRGFARSRSKIPSDDSVTPNQIIDRNARDAAALIRRFRSREESAYIYGSCFGGTILLQLLQNDPELVRHAFVHEPAVPLLVSPSAMSSVLSTFSSLPEVFADEGGETAAAAVTALIIDKAGREALQQSEAYDRLVTHAAENMPYHYTHESRFAATHTVDWGLLHTQRDKMTLAIGSESTLPLQKDPVQFIASKLDLQIVKTPGAHFPFSIDRDRTIDQLISLFGQPALQQSLQSRESGIALLVDGKIAGQYSAREWSDFVNLADASSCLKGQTSLRLVDI